MITIYLALCGAAVFGLCFLIDRLISRLTRKTESTRSVRQPTRAAGIGIVLLVGGIALLLFLKEKLGLIGGIVLVALGAVLIASYFFFRLDYDSEGFTCKTLRGTTRYSFNQIRAEQALSTRSGIAVMLFVGGDTVELSEAMQGVRDFLSFAYYARCRQMGIDPEDAPPPAPEDLLWFPPPEDEAAPGAS